jgi:flagellar motor switch protein FliM
VDRSLTQDEINGLFRNARGSAEEAAERAVPYDFRRPDRIAKEQLRAVHLLHDGFARTLASSLSAYLRAYVVVNLVSVEQLSFAEFSQCLPSPTCLVSLGLKPYEGNAVLEISSSVVFPILEMLLGGNGKTSSNIRREVTEIEQVVLDGLYRIILHDLRQAWGGITPIDFTIDARETEPQLLQVMAPNEAVVAIGLEVRMPDNSGMINIGMPSIIIKMLRQKFEQQWSVRRAESTADEQHRVYRLIRSAQMLLDSRLQGPTLQVKDMAALRVDDVLKFDFSVDRPVDLLVNGRLKYKGRLVTTGHKKAFMIEATHKPGD